MNGRMVGRILGLVLLTLAGLLLLPLLVGLIYRERVMGFLVTALLCAAIGGVLLLFKPKSREIFAKEGFTAVGLTWTLMSLLGALPFVINGSIPNYIDAVFETASGFTTTGASILNNCELLPHADQFWRIFTHWLGGMGVLVFVMAVLPMSESRAMHIMRAEMPGPTVGKLVPRARKTALILYLTYAGLTVVEAVLLMFGGMSFFEALLHAFATAGTGGFSTRAASIGGFQSLYIEMVIAVFLVLFGINFNLYYFVLIGRFKEALKSEELHVYFALIGVSVLAIALGITKMYGGFATALRHAFFNVMTMVSTAGFGTVDFTTWPDYCQSILVILMFIGGCAGSTGGGLKLSRVMLLIKTAVADVQRMVSPRRVTRIELDGRRVSQETASAVYTYFALYMLLLLGCMVIVSFDGYDFATNFTAALSCMSNVGPGLGRISPAGNFAIFSPLSKITMTLTMLFGRLEIYAMLILFIPSTWRKRS